MFNSKIKKGLVALLTGSMVIGSMILPAGAASNGKSISLNQDKIIYGNIEDNTTNYRIELRNEYGDTKDKVLKGTDVQAANRIEVKFTISGLDAVKDKSYKATMCFADADWSHQSMGQKSHKGDATIKGDGTYTVTLNLDDLETGDAKTPISSALVFCIDIPDLGKDLLDANVNINNFKRDGSTAVLDSSAKTDVTISDVSVTCYDEAAATTSDDKSTTTKTDSTAAAATDAAATTAATTAPTTDTTKTTGDVSLALVYGALIVCAGGLVVVNLRRKQMH